MPLLFAAQQTIEGLLWLTLPNPADARIAHGLTDGFLFFALVFWPVFAPFSTYAIEDDPKRRTAIGVCLLAGAAAAIYLAAIVFGGGHGASIESGHIVYRLDQNPETAFGPLYLLATGVAPTLSSHRAVTLLGFIVVAGSLVAWFAYWEAFVSVWCFFAAGASAAIVGHFVSARQSTQAAPRR